VIILRRDRQIKGMWLDLSLVCDLSGQIHT